MHIHLTLKNRFALLTILILLFSCTSPKSQQYQPGDLPFQKLNPKEITQLTLAVQLPETHQNWILTLERKDSLWMITSSAGTPEIQDRFARGNSILHLLDSLSSTRIEKKAPNAPLGEFHLSPPRYAIKAVSPQQTFELWLGDQTNSQVHDSFALFGDSHSTPWIIQSSALPILQSIENWKHLRKPEIAFETSDDIDEIKILNHQKEVFYAQRDGEVWTNAAHQPVRASIEKLLHELLTELPLALLEEKDLINSTHKRSPSTPVLLREIHLAGALTSPIEMKLYSHQGKHYLTYSRRPQSYFEIPKKLSEKIQAYKKG